MKIGLYNPYFDSLGGGERYVHIAGIETHDVVSFGMMRVLYLKLKNALM